MVDTSIGINPIIVFGEAISTTDKEKLKDVQAGEVIARWHGHQPEEDIPDDQLPACKLMGATDNHNLANFGGNHFGIIGKNDPHNPTADGQSSGGSGDKNQKADNESVLKYSEKRGGPKQAPMLHNKHDDAIAYTKHMKDI